MESNLVNELSERLSQLQTEKEALEAAVEEQGDALALKLRLALLQYEQNRPRHRHEEGRRRRSKSRSSSGASPSSSVSTSASTSSSASFPASPAQMSPVALQTLRENEALRVRLANSERVNAYYQRELAELRRRCGISISELEELELSGNEEPLASGSSTNGTSTGRRRHRSMSGTDWGASPSTSMGTGSIRIPGAASVSPPAARLSTASFPFSTSVNSRLLQPQSYTSYTSSVGTAITTPSSSYPLARAPAPTPAGSVAFSPASVRSVSSSGFQGRRNSLSLLVSAALAEVQREQAAEESGSAVNSTSRTSGGGIDLEDLLHISSSSSSSIISLDSGSSSLSTSAFPPGSALNSRTTSASSSFIPPSHVPTATNSAPSSDPLVAAITRSLAKLASADALGNERRPRRRLQDDEEEYEEEDEVDSGSSSTTSREGTEGEVVEEGNVRLESQGKEEAEDGGETPLSISPGSRSGSLSRKASTSARSRYSCGGSGAGGAGGKRLAL